MNYTLRLVCSQCSADITWQQYRNGAWQTMKCKEQILEFPADQVVPSLAGCYCCWCSTSHAEESIAIDTISVDVEPPGEQC